MASDLFHPYLFIGTLDVARNSTDERVRYDWYYVMVDAMRNEDHVFHVMRDGNYVLIW